MSKSQRTKGAAFEREICDVFTSALNPPTPFKRNIGQARDGGNDIDVGPLLIECKRRKTLGTVYAWLQQAVDATFVRPDPRSSTRFAPYRRTVSADDPTPMIPVVVARQDGDTAPIVILKLTDFIALTRDELMAHFDQPAGPAGQE